LNEVGTLRSPLGLEPRRAGLEAHRSGESGSLLYGVGSNSRRAITNLAGLLPGNPKTTILPRAAGYSSALLQDLVDNLGARAELPSYFLPHRIVPGA